jgi:hypothetical protein
VLPNTHAHTHARARAHTHTHTRTHTPTHPHTHTHIEHALIRGQVHRRPRGHVLGQRGHHRRRRDLRQTSVLGSWGHHHEHHPAVRTALAFIMTSDVKAPIPHLFHILDGSNTSLANNQANKQKNKKQKTSNQTTKQSALDRSC